MPSAKRYEAGSGLIETIGLIASLALQALDNSFEPRLHLLRHLGEARIATCVYRELHPH